MEYINRKVLALGTYICSGVGKLHLNILITVANMFAIFCYNRSRSIHGLPHGINRLQRKNLPLVLSSHALQSAKRTVFGEVAALNFTSVQLRQIDNVRCCQFSSLMARLHCSFSINRAYTRHNHAPERLTI